MKNGEKYNNSRRSFVKSITASLLLIPFLQFCTDKVVALLIRLSGTNHILGHRLRLQDFPEPSQAVQTQYLIVGGGIAGLSAARELTKRGISDFLLVELEDHLGGNSSNGENQYSKFPLGAHYLPLPNFEDKILLQFLEEEKIVLGYDREGYPIFDELQLTFAPEERLYYKNNWQEGLIPKYGNTASENSEFQRFFEIMDHYRTAKGKDGKFLFTIPMSACSSDKNIRKLDDITMQQWFDEAKFTSEALFYYIDYCCRDDFGLGIRYVSAWAGHHYFAARKQDASPDSRDSVLTWPEGNARLAFHLKKYSEGKSLKKSLVYEINIEKSKVIAKIFNETTKTTSTITADKVIMATPQFVNQYILKNRREFTQSFHYAPWLLATLTVNNLSDDLSFPLCWDNVIQGSKGLGYIYDQHQSIQQQHNKKVITYYYSFSEADLKKVRKEIYKKKVDFWKQMVFDDLKIAHPMIESDTEEINIHILGHGMISPVPKFIFGEDKQAAAKSIQNKIFFAHSDLSGISIFEEAFHQGINAVNQMLDATKLDT